MHRLIRNLTSKIYTLYGKIFWNQINVLWINRTIGKVKLNMMNKINEIVHSGLAAFELCKIGWSIEYLNLNYLFESSGFKVHSACVLWSQGALLNASNQITNADRLVLDSLLRVNFNSLNFKNDNKNSFFEFNLSDLFIVSELRRFSGLFGAQLWADISLSMCHKHRLLSRHQIKETCMQKSFGSGA